MDEFKEIAHCGGRITISVYTTSNGKKDYGLKFTSSRPNQANIATIYALPQGIPVEVCGFRGMTLPEPPLHGCLLIFLCSDQQGYFGHECPNCNQYWRSDGPSAVSNTICPYCANTGKSHIFLTKNQRNYIRQFCYLINESMSKTKGFLIDMDKVADFSEKESEKPPFYYAEESQQKRFTCSCNTFNDILGRFAYCCRCGEYNGVVELKSDIELIKSKYKSGNYEDCLRNAVSSFDSILKHYLNQLVKRTPMTDRRKKCWNRTFHNLKSIHKSLKEHFDIDIFSNFGEEDINFMKKMFHKRHVYEHKGGVVDQKYINDSEDKSVRLGQSIHETNDSISKALELILKMGENFHKGFHSIFPITRSQL